MMREITPQEWPSILASDPNIRQILDQYKAQHPGAWGSPVDTVNHYLATKGLSLPNEWGLDKNSGQIYEPSLTGWDAFTHVGLPALGAAVAPWAIGALAGGGAAGAGSVAGDFIDPGIIGMNGGTGLGAAMAGAGAATAAGAAAGGTSLWKSLAAPVIGAGANVVGSIIQGHSQDAATQAALEKAKEAQAFLEKKYAQTQNQVAPYIGMGQGALAALGNGLGVHAPNPAILTAGQSLPMGTTVTGRAPVQPPGGNAPIQPMTMDPNSQPDMPMAPMMGSPAQAPERQTASGVQPAKVGEQRIINGQTATWDGRGWSA